MPSNKSATKPKSDDRPVPRWEWSFEAIGTQWWIGAYEQLEHADELQHAIARLIDDFDDTYSRFRTGSLVTRMSENAGTYVLPANAAPLLRLYRDLYDCTEGRLTPLVGRLLADVGYDATYTFRAKPNVSDIPRWDDVLSMDGTKLTVHKPALLDFGAAGKGYLVDLVASLLKQEGIKSFCVDAGGDMYCHNVGLVVGLEDPLNSSVAIGTVKLQNQALCGSAPNRRAWGSYHHIMDPVTKHSTENLDAVWVAAESAMLADGLTTALFFTEPERLLRQFKFEYALVYADGRLRYSQGFPVTFFAKETI